MNSEQQKWDKLKKDLLEYCEEFLTQLTDACLSEVDKALTELPVAHRSKENGLMGVCWPMTVMFTKAMSNMQEETQKKIEEWRKEPT